MNAEELRDIMTVHCEKVGRATEAHRVCVLISRKMDGEEGTIMDAEHYTTVSAWGGDVDAPIDALEMLMETVATVLVTSYPGEPEDMAKDAVELIANMLYNRIMDYAEHAGTGVSMGRHEVEHTGEDDG